MVAAAVRQVLWVVPLLVGVAAAQDRAPLLATPDQVSYQQAARSLSEGDSAKAFEHFIQSARYGNKQAQKSIALMYIKGAGVPHDWARAYAWFRLAGTHGDEKILQAGDEVWNALKEEEKAHSSRIYQELVPSYGDVAALALRREWVKVQKRRLAGGSPASSTRVQLADASGFSWELTGQEYLDLLDNYVNGFGEQNLSDDALEVLN
ncbi:MAG: hypothetical protein QNJ40_09065 [Xanthomonadales bacterium]|nr:hypothetical protein [Xanthomonadales bacterium]